MFNSFGITGVLGAFLAGAGAMYFLDDRSGGRRRAIVRDKAVRARHVAVDAMGDVERDFENRARGMLARIGSVFEPAPADDNVLVERVRAKLGHVCSHPSAVQVVAKGNGAIELKGPVLARDKFHLLASIAALPGVRMIDDDLDVHATADIPALQGEARHVTFIQRHWNPTTRFLLGASGGVCVLRGLLKGGVMGGVHLGVGSALIATSLVELPSTSRMQQSAISTRAAQPSRATARA
jgi:hypothetical protein